MIATDDEGELVDADEVDRADADENKSGSDDRVGVRVMRGLCCGRDCAATSRRIAAQFSTRGISGKRAPKRVSLCITKTEQFVKRKTLPTC
ncbi:MAG: hypothetical protein WB689_40405 [Xanthobacteraceae bacterium]